MPGLSSESPWTFENYRFQHPSPRGSDSVDWGSGLRIWILKNLLRWPSCVWERNAGWVLGLGSRCPYFVTWQVPSPPGAVCLSSSDIQGSARCPCRGRRGLSTLTSAQPCLCMTGFHLTRRNSYVPLLQEDVLISVNFKSFSPTRKTLAPLSLARTREALWVILPSRRRKLVWTFKSVKKNY